MIDVMVYFGRLKGLGAEQARRWSRDYLERVGIGDKEKVRLDKLSGGQQQKVQLGVTIMNDPELLILDEPTKGFDPVNRRLLMDIIDDQKRAGSTVMMVTHQMEEVERLCDRVILLKDGMSRAYGTVERGAGAVRRHDRPRRPRRRDPRVPRVPGALGRGGSRTAGARRRRRHRRHPARPRGCGRPRVPASPRPANPSTTSSSRSTAPRARRTDHGSPQPQHRHRFRVPPHDHQAPVLGDHADHPDPRLRPRRPHHRVQRLRRRTRPTSRRTPASSSCTPTRPDS